MLKLVVEKLWKTSGKLVLKPVESSPQAGGHRNIAPRILWENNDFSHFIHETFPRLNTGLKTNFIAVKNQLFHIFHIAYYYDDEIFNKKGIK